VTCTIGLAELGPGTDRVEDLIKNAERANQRGRQRGGNQVVLEETSDESTRIKRFDALWLHQIKSALLANRFRLTHLSIASLSGQAEKFFDTILRMIDEQGDEVSASEFMEVARRNKMMRPLDRWVIGATLEFAASQHFDLVFIKLSGETIRDATTVDWIKAQAADKSIPPGRLCFQISESDATQHLKQTLKIVGDLRGAGFKFAIEHFGIGRDPLRLLNQMPMDFVKIDGSLMEGIGGDSMRQEKIRSFVNTALKRKVATIAERVEDANTMAVLFQLGIGYMQGHYLHEPDVVLEELI
jgi:EAL domain-containing protein (putative c-di-GMP-specific phosphodiesterase class I)